MKVQLEQRRLDAALREARRWQSFEGGVWSGFSHRGCIAVVWVTPILAAVVDRFVGRGWHPFPGLATSDPHASSVVSMPGDSVVLRRCLVENTYVVTIEGRGSVVVDDCTIVFDSPDGRNRYTIPFAVVAGVRDSENERLFTERFNKTAQRGLDGREDAARAAT